MTSSVKNDSFVWIDLEMTGLDAGKDRILEVACIITDTDLNKKHEGLNMIIHQPNEVLNSMNDWCKVNHGKTGLTKAVQSSKITEEEADFDLSNYIKEYTQSNGTRFLAGNTVHMDKRFLEKYMPKTDSLLHYRIIDVSTVKELCNHWYPEMYKSIISKKLVHRALDDIQESIDELKLYRTHMFIK